jgi:hypothetical protein
MQNTCYKKTEQKIRGHFVQQFNKRMNIFFHMVLYLKNASQSMDCDAKIRDFV